MEEYNSELKDKVDNLIVECLQTINNEIENCFTQWIEEVRGTHEEIVALKFLMLQTQRECGIVILLKGEECPVWIVRGENVWYPREEENKKYPITSKYLDLILPAIAEMQKYRKNRYYNTYTGSYVSNNMKIEVKND